MTTHERFRLKLSVDEIVSLCSLLELPAFPGVSDAVINAGTQEERDERIASGGRSLLARELLTQENADDVAVQPALISLLERLTQPLVTVFAFRTTGTDAYARFWHVAEQAVLEEGEDGNGVLLFESHPVEDARASFRAFLGLDGRSAPEGSPFSIAESALFELSDSPTADTAAKAAFTTALAASRGVSFVEAAYTQDGAVGAGGRVAWVDGGEQGCWLVEPSSGVPDSGERQYTITPQETATIVERIAACVPELLSAG